MLIRCLAIHALNCREANIANLGSVPWSSRAASLLLSSGDNGYLSDYSWLFVTALSVSMVVPYVTHDRLGFNRKRIRILLEYRLKRICSKIR